MVPEFVEGERVRIVESGRVAVVRGEVRPGFFKIAVQPFMGEAVYAGGDLEAVL